MRIEIVFNKLILATSYSLSGAGLILRRLKRLRHHNEASYAQEAKSRSPVLSGAVIEGVYYEQKFTAKRLAFFVAVNPRFTVRSSVLCCKGMDA